MSQEQKHAEAGKDRFENQVEVVGCWKRQQEIADKADWICSIDMGIGQQRSATIRVGVPPRENSLPEALVNPVLKGKVVGGLVNDVVVGRDSGSCRIHKTKMLE